MSKLQQNGRRSSHAFVSLPCHVCHELVKLHGLEFHVRKSIIEEVKTPPRTLVCELSPSAVANNQQSMHKMAPVNNDLTSRLPIPTTEEQHPIRTLIIHFLMQLYQRRKTSQFFWTVYFEA